MKFSILVVLLFSYFAKAQSTECLSIIESGQPLESKVNAIVELEDSWVCLNQFYNAITKKHFNIAYQTGHFKDPVFQSVINVPARIRYLVDQYAEHGFSFQFRIPHFFDNNDYPIVLFLSRIFMSKNETFSRRKPNVFENFPLELKQHLSLLLLQSRFFSNPYASFMSDPSLLPVHGQSSSLPEAAEMNLNTQNLFIDFPIFILCPEAQESIDPSWGEYYNRVSNSTSKYIERNPETLSLYLSVLDFYNISQGQTSSLIPIPNRVIYSFPYGFEYQNIPEPLLSRLSEMEKESLSEWIHQLKTFTFARILFGGYIGCLPNMFQETLYISYTDILPPPLSAQPSLQKADSKAEEFSPFFEIQYFLNEYPLLSHALESSTQTLSYHQASFRLTESTENDFAENQDPAFFEIERPLYKIILGKEL